MYLIGKRQLLTYETQHVSYGKRQLLTYEYLSGEDNC